MRCRRSRPSHGRWCSSRHRTGWRSRCWRWRRRSAPDREAAVCRELTKTYEEVKRGPLAELATWAAAGVRGEITVVVSGAAARTSSGLDDEALAALVSERVAAGMSRKEAVAEVVDMTGESRNRVYAAVARGQTRWPALDNLEG